MPCHVLVVDDDPVQRRLAEAAISKGGYRTVCAEGGEAALGVLEGPEGGGISALVLDLMMPEVDGLQVLSRLRARGIDIPVIVQTARGSIDAAVQAMRAGAFDFVVKPAAPERLLAALANALKYAELKTGATTGAARRGRVPTRGFDGVVTGSPAMERVLTLARKAASSTIPIMIEGESGVGKEVIARAIQGMGARADKPFVTVNCGAIPENLVESILFGHEKGSFTGASEKHVGKFVEADGGTLFLDEIGDLPLDVQVKLLRAVQDGEVDPVGARATVKVDIRLISATHRDLMRQVGEGRFREDLYYRLNVFPIHVPPLRERREDIARLVRHFIARAGSAAAGTRVRDVSARALAMLEAYDWPGNIRQLENAIFRAVVLAEGDVLTEDEFPQIGGQTRRVGPDAREEPAAFAGGGRHENAVPMPHFALPDEPEGVLRALDERGDVRALADVEGEMIRLAIDHYNGQMSEVARRLGIGRSTLYRKLKEMGIDPERQRGERLAF
ncbi:MAG: sigma-54 dependent transcriptional regulator [Aquamicrobium sp.]|uniref:sigma-54-dependent transcriptional regulator n=1 Tax=Aquamicrobium sp. TaxID=1872579 RepID=UPI00349EF853|nr:sigma-54 dependent transcriptional regulator [Aquamicrobium sp.]